MDQIILDFHTVNLLPVELYRYAVVVIGLVTMLLTCIRSMTRH